MSMAQEAERLKKIASLRAFGFTDSAATALVSLDSAGRSAYLKGLGLSGSYLDRTERILNIVILRGEPLSVAIERVDSDLRMKAGSNVVTGTAMVNAAKEGSTVKAKKAKSKPGGKPGRDTGTKPRTEGKGKPKKQKSNSEGSSAETALAVTGIGLGLALAIKGRSKLNE